MIQVGHNTDQNGESSVLMSIFPVFSLIPTILVVPKIHESLSIMNLVAFEGVNYNKQSAS